MKNIFITTILSSSFILFSSISYAGNFQITSKTVNEHADMTSACKTEFGNSYQLADWTNHIIPSYKNGMNIDDIIPRPTGEQISVWVSNNGKEFWSSTRHYLATRFLKEHVLPSHYLAHDDIDNYLLLLGSWYANIPVLCYSDSKQTDTTENQCWATYENGKLHIPCVKVKSQFGNVFKYEIDMQYQPSSEAISFQLTGAKPKE
jgi:hypothetical protein